MKLLITLMIAFYGITAAAVTPAMNILKYEYAEPAAGSRHMGQFGPYYKITVNVANNGIALVTKSYESSTLDEATGGMDMHSEIVQQEIVYVTRREMGQIYRFYRDIQYAEIEEYYSQVVCMMIPTPGMSVNNLYAYDGFEATLVHNAGHCAMPYKVYPADKALLQESRAIKQLLRSIGENALQFEDSVN